MRHQIVYLFFFADFYFAPMYLFIFFFLVVIVYIYFMIYKGVKRHHICLPVIVTSCFPEPSRYSLWNIKGKGIRRNKNRICKLVIQRIKQSLVLVSFFTAVILGTSCKLTFIIHNLNEQNSRLNFHYFLYFSPFINIVSCKTLSAKAQSKEINYYKPVYYFSMAKPSLCK